MEADRDDVEPGDATSTAARDATGSEGGDSAPGSTATAARVPSADSVPPVGSYQIKPALKDRFRADPIREIMRSVMAGVLRDKVYSGESAKKWTIQVADEVNAKVRELHMKRYKHVVQVVIGEMKGAGVKCGVRCVWDAETDGYTSETYINDSLFSVCVVFAVYLY